MKMKYIIPEIPPSNNKFIGRNARWEYQNVKKYWEELIFYTCRPRPDKPFKKAVVKLAYYFPDKRRRDSDNYAGKLILDGLVRAGIIEDDSFDNVQLVLRGGYDKENPRTEIEVEEV